MSDIDFLLRQWALWARSTGLSLSYPSIEPYTRMLPRPATGLVIDDDEGQRIDRAVSILRLQHPQEHDAIARHYIARQAYREIAREYGYNGHRRVAELIAGGKRYVEGLLYHKT